MTVSPNTTGDIFSTVESKCIYLHLEYDTALNKDVGLLGVCKWLQSSFRLGQLNVITCHSCSSFPHFAASTFLEKWFISFSLFFALQCRNTGETWYSVNLFQTSVLLSPKKKTQFFFTSFFLNWVCYVIILTTTKVCINIFSSSFFWAAVGRTLVAGCFKNTRHWALNDLCLHTLRWSSSHWSSSTAECWGEHG